MNRRDFIKATGAFIAVPTLLKGADDYCPAICHDDWTIRTKAQAQFTNRVDRILQLGLQDRIHDTSTWNRQDPHFTGSIEIPYAVLEDKSTVEDIIAGLGLTIEESLNASIGKNAVIEYMAVFPYHPSSHNKEVIQINYFVKGRNDGITRS